MNKKPTSYVYLLHYTVRGSSENYRFISTKDFKPALKIALDRTQKFHANQTIDPRSFTRYEGDEVLDDMDSML